MSDCIFCKIIAGKMPSYTIYEDDKYKVILDRFPSNAGHSLIIPKKHIDDIFALDPDTASGIYVLATELAPVLRDTLNADGLNILQNNGVIAGQTVGHFHVHLIPRYENDNVNIKWQTVDPPPEEFEKIMTALKEGRR